MLTKELDNLISNIILQGTPLQQKPTDRKLFLFGCESAKSSPLAEEGGEAVT
jgi:hypothetical protein